MEGTSSLIGVGIAILANTLISAGLNVERLAHIRRAHPNEKRKERKQRERADSTASRQSRSISNSQSFTTPNETTPLILVDAASTSPSSNKIPPPYSRSLSDPISSLPSNASPSVLLSLPPPPPAARRTSSHRSNSQRKSSNQSTRPRTDKGFLRSPLWLGGFLLINLGEIGNFLAYGFAPTSLVAPLGMTALVANVFLAPAIVGEPFRRKDLLGIFIAICGGATVVYASRSSDKKITPKELVSAISQPLFIAYTVLSCILMSLLGYLSQTRLGDKFVLIDLTLCALAGAFTVLSTKALSSFLNLMFLDTFTQPITYPLLLILISTAFLQVNFINKSLQRFESRVVIPTQYMTFALSSILGSAILYGDFRGMKPEKLLNFGFGCLVSAAGVYLLTRDSLPSSSSSEEPKPSPTSSSSHPTPAPPTSSAEDPLLIPISLHPSQRHNLPLSLSVSPNQTRLVLPGGGLKNRGRKLSVGRFATGGYLLVGSPKGSRMDDESESDEEESNEEEEDGMNAREEV
ncbi:hypothetical protein JCM5353_005211 [Sporobolomyces roseus]